MDLFELQSFYASQFPKKRVTFEFDDNCHRVAEIIYTNGVPHEVCHVECNKVKVSVEGMEPTYITIAPHRFNTTWKGLKDYLNAKSDVHISAKELEDIRGIKTSDPETYQERVATKMQNTGMSKEKIESMMQV